MASPLVSHPDIRALAIALAAFGVLYWLGSFGVSAIVNWWFYPSVPEDLPENIASSPLWQVFGFALYILPGFLAGFLARRSGLMHGLIVGVLTVPTMFLILVAAGVSQSIAGTSLLYGLGLGLFWCSGASLLGEFVASRMRHS